MAMEKLSAAGLLLMILVLPQLVCIPDAWLKPLDFRWWRWSVLVPFLVAYLSESAYRWYSVPALLPGPSAYESMIYVAWATALAGLLFIKRSFMALALAAFLFAGIILFVANLKLHRPGESTPLILAVLKYFWLMIHVAVITASYGFFDYQFSARYASLHS